MCFSPFPVVAAVTVVISTFCFLLLSDDCEELGERTKRFVSLRGFEADNKDKVRSYPVKEGEHLTGNVSAACL